MKIGVRRNKQPIQYLNLVSAALENMFNSEQRKHRPKQTILSGFYLYSIQSSHTTSQTNSSQQKYHTHYQPIKQSPNDASDFGREIL